MIAASIGVYTVALFYLYQYRTFQESLLKFFFHSDKISLRRDAERFRVLKTFLTEGDDSLFNYSFSIKDKEDFLERED